METRLYTVDVYNYDELTDSAKENAFYNWYSQHDCDCTDDEYKSTLENLERVFGFTVNDWEVNGFSAPSLYRFSCEDVTGNWLRIAKYVINNYYDKVYRPFRYGSYNGKQMYSKVK